MKRHVGNWIILAIVMYGMNFREAAAIPRYDYVFGGADYQAPVGGTIEVPVFLQETVQSGDTAVLGPGGPGLWGAGVTVVYGDPPQPSDPARVLSTSDILPSAAFDQQTPSVAMNQAKLALFCLTNPAVYGVEYSPGVYRLELGKFRFTAGTIPGESTPLRAIDYDPTLDDVVTSDQRALDGSPIHEGTAVITTVPEPAAAILLIAAFSMVAISRMVWKMG
jgi:hypothetical protein